MAEGGRRRVSEPVCLLWCLFSWSEREKLWPQSVKSHWYGFSPGTNTGRHGGGDSVHLLSLTASLASISRQLATKAELIHPGRIFTMLSESLGATLIYKLTLRENT